jgi:hypothetical protein
MFWFFKTSVLDDDTTCGRYLSEVTSSNYRNRCGLGCKVIDVFQLMQEIRNGAEAALKKCT